MRGEVYFFAQGGDGAVDGGGVVCEDPFGEAVQVFAGDDGFEFGGDLGITAGGFELGAECFGGGLDLGDLLGCFGIAVYAGFVAALDAFATGGKAFDGGADVLARILRGGWVGLLVL